MPYTITCCDYVQLRKHCFVIRIGLSLHTVLSSIKKRAPLRPPPTSFLPFVSAALILELPAAAHSFPSAGDRVDESVASRGSSAAVTPGSWHIKYHFILLFTCLQVPGIEVARAKQIY